MASDFTNELHKNERVIAENDLAFALLTYIPITPGHTLVCPKREVATFAELTNEELLAISKLTKKVMTALEKTFGAKGFNCAWNQGANFGQSIPHFHLHIVPRTPGDSGIYQYEPREFLYRPGGRKILPNNTLTPIAQEIRNNLPKH